MELPNKLTPVEPKDFYQMLARCWTHVFGSLPRRESLLVLMAQSALETGHWKSIHCYNFGNVKAVPGSSRGYTFFACNELLTPEQAASAVKGEHPATIKGNAGNGLLNVWFYPKHPACCFRAYGGDSEEAAFTAGMLDYLNILYDRYQGAWDAVLDGNPGLFVEKLKASKYFTANLEKYRSDVVWLYNHYAKQDLGDIPTVTEGSGKITDSAVLGLVWHTLDQASKENIEEVLARSSQDS